MSLYYYQNDHISPYMHDLYYGDTFVLKKKANYREKLTCGLLSVDNVYKIYDWDESNVCQGRRLIRL
jgi:hypothetical protein